MRISLAADVEVRAAIARDACQRFEVVNAARFCRAGDANDSDDLRPRRQSRHRRFESGDVGDLVALHSHRR